MRIHSRYSEWACRRSQSVGRIEVMGDDSMKPQFIGMDCALCKRPNWKIQQKDLQ